MCIRGGFSRNYTDTAAFGRILDERCPTPVVANVNYFSINSGRLLIRPFPSHPKTPFTDVFCIQNTLLHLYLFYTLSADVYFSKKILLQSFMLVSIVRVPTT